MSDVIPSYTLAGAGNSVQCFPRDRYREQADTETLFSPEGSCFERQDAISPRTLDTYGARYGRRVSADDIFY
jgi:hypothetical protein